MRWSEVWVYVGTISGIVDGDTFVATVDLGFHVHKDLTFRLRGISEDPNHEAKMEGIATLLPLGRSVTIVSYKPDWRDAQERWQADVLLADGTNVARRLLLLAQAEPEAS